MTVADEAANTAAKMVSQKQGSAFTAALVEHRGNRTATADSLGVNRKTLFNKMREYGMTTDGEPEALD